MPEIATYKCSNYQCGLTLRLSKNFPVWHSHTPKEIRLRPGHPSAGAFIERLRSESFCLNCKKVVEYAEPNTCKACEGPVEAEQLGAACPLCGQGVMMMPRLSLF